MTLSYLYNAILYTCQWLLYTGMPTLIYVTVDMKTNCNKLQYIHLHAHIDGLVQERRNSTANALELCLSCTNPSICNSTFGEKYIIHE